MTENLHIRHIAIQNLELRRGFKAHFMFYVVFSILFLAVDTMFTGMTWSIIAVTIWGIGIISHFFGMRYRIKNNSNPNQNFSEDSIQKEISHLKNQ